MNIRHSLLALSALDAVRPRLSPNMARPGPRRPRPRRLQSPRAPVAEPWMAQPPPAPPASRGSRPSPSANKCAGARADRSAAGDRAGRRHDLHRRGAGARARSTTTARWATCASLPGAARRSISSPRSTRSTPTFAAAWSNTGSAGATCRKLPIPAGPTLKPGSTGERVAMLRDAARARRRRQVSTRRSPRRSRNSRRSTASRTTGSPARARSTRSTAAPNIMSS